MHEIILFYNRLEVPTQKILDSKGVIPSKTAADAKVAIQKMAKYSQKWHNGTSRTRSTKTSDGLTAIQAQLNILEEKSRKLMKRAATPGLYQRNNANPSYQERRQSMDETLSKFMRASVSVMPLSTYHNLGLGIDKFVFPVDFINLDMLEDVKVPLILGRSFLSTAHAKIDVFKRNITLRVREEKIIFRSVKPARSLIKRVYMLSLRERMELDLEAMLIGETLVLNRSLYPSNEDYIKLNDLNEPLELRIDQIDDLMPTIEDAKLIDAPMDDLAKSKNDELNTRIDDYPSYCDYNKKIRTDSAHNLKSSCMIGFDFIHVYFFPILYVNVMSKKFYNSIMKDKLEYKGNNVLGALKNVPIFVGTFSVVTDFAVLENINAYRNEGMGDVIVGEPFLKEIRIKARRFEGMITIYNCNEELTYQMMRSHPRFKHHTNKQCNKIPSLLKAD
nr:hypothetical protein [Tanacetum cinerariifolium]